MSEHNMTLARASTAGVMLKNSTTVDDINKAIDLFKSIPVADKWIVVRPDGKVFTGKLEDVMPVLMREHPLLQPNKWADGGNAMADALGGL